MFSTQDLGNIFAGVEMETDGERLAFALDALSATPENDPSSSIKMLLHTSTMITSFFKYHEDIHQCRDLVKIARFKDAATFTTTLCLLMHETFDMNIHRKELAEQYLIHTKKLAAMSQSVCANNSLDVLRYLLVKILKWKQDSLSSNADIRKTIESILFDLCIAIHSHITAGAATDEKNNIHIEYIYRLQIHRKVCNDSNSCIAAITKKYINSSHAYLYSQTTSSHRHKALSCLYQTYQLLGSALTLKDIEWLEQMSQQFHDEYLASCPLTKSILNAMTRYYLYLAENPWTAAGLAVVSANLGCFAYQLKCLLYEVNQHTQLDATDPRIRLALTLTPLVLSTLGATKLHQKYQSSNFFRPVDVEAPPPLPVYFQELKLKLISESQNSNDSDKHPSYTI